VSAGEQVTPVPGDGTALPAWSLRSATRWGVWLAPAAILAAVALVAITQGAASIPPQTVIAILLNRLPLVAIELDVPATWDRIVVDVRLPRIIAAGLVGAALAYAGASYQGVFRNPLADPFLIGVASGAALGASIAIVSPLPVDSYGFGWVPVFAFVGAFVTVGLVYSIARTAQAVNNTTLILAGVALSAVASAATSFMLLTGGERAQPILSFLFGGFNTAAWPRILAGLPYILVGVLVIALHTRVLNVLQLDEEQAGQLGVDVVRTKLIMLAAASLIAATAVAIAGIIGFVGLVVPHVVRLLYGPDYRRVLPAAALTGAAFLIAVDVFARTVIAPQEVPVGIVTAVIGGPFFLYLLRSRKVHAL
jgi:iron complex transport system permease protein